MRWVAWLGLSACAPPAPADAVSAEPDPEVPMTNARGAVTWTVTADAGAAEAGFTDCAYTRRYEASEDRSTPWLCPSCDLQLRAAVSVDAQDLDCYASISGGAAPRAVERLGLQGQSWLRSSYEHLPIAVAGAVDDLGDGRLALTGDPVVAPVGAGTITITARGELELEETTGDPWHGLTPPADPTCGWDVRPSPDYDGAWHLAVGAQLPDGLFADACGQGVRLHDLAGSYLVVEISALDCGPCQQMASEVRLFQDLALQHLRRVEVVTLLAPSLSAPLDPTPPSLLTLWSETFGLASPVLGDRGWGITMSEDAFGGLSYPTWIIASPSLEVVATGQGFGGWTPILDTLLAHHE